MNEYYKCNVCGKLKKKDNILGNYENYTCDECFKKYCTEKNKKIKEEN